MTAVTSMLRTVPRTGLDVAAVAGGLVEFYARGDVSQRARNALLALHCRTNGRFTAKLAALFRLMRPPRPAAPVRGLLGALAVAEQQRIVGAIAKDGFYIFERRLPAALCDEIEAFAARTPGLVEGGTPERPVVFDFAQPISKTYRISEADMIGNHAAQRLMADPSFLAIAERYLATHPILSGANLWWSATYGATPGADAAQEFHFDFDPPPAWLLFFFYLTDVGPENGPHVFVRGSHVPDHPAAAEFLSRGYVRISDDEIAARFGPENIIELYGARGTIMAVDTRGFHKGKMPTTGRRLMAQLTFSCPPFSGAHGRRQKLPDTLDPSLTKALEAAPNVYRQRYR